MVGSQKPLLGEILYFQCITLQQGKVAFNVSSSSLKACLSKNKGYYENLQK